jgi:hypothetical protein
LRVERVYSKGKSLVEKGKSLFQGHYWIDPYFEKYH